MRTDVKVGLICGFSLVLAVVIYYVAIGNARPQNARADDGARNTPAPVAPGARASTPTTPATLPSVTPPTPTETLLAQGNVPTGGPGNVGGALITPPSSPSAPISSTPAPGGLSVTPPAPGSSAPALSGGLPTASSSGSSTTLPTAAGPGYVGLDNSRTTSSHLPTASSSHLPGSSSSTPLPGSSGTRTTSSTPGHSTFTGSSLSGTSSSFGTSSLSGTSGPTTHKIEKGDMLSTIAKKYGVTVKAIETANPGIDSSRLTVGKDIKIPAKTATASSTSTPTGSTLSLPGSSAGSSSSTPTTRPAGSARRHHPEGSVEPALPDQVVTASNTSTSTSTSSTPSSGTPKPGSAYTVKRGDTLTKIAEQAYGDKSATTRILKANHVANANIIPVGTVLQLPN